MIKDNLLIGAISGNYSIDDVRTWVETSKFDNVYRTLLVYNENDNPELIQYLMDNEIECISPKNDMWGNYINKFETNTGAVTVENSYYLIHNIRFFHIWLYLKENNFEKVLITDVRDVYFNNNPFDKMQSDYITVTSEEVTYNQELWNKEHLLHTLGFIGYEELKNMLVYNVGVFGGNNDLVKDICKDIYLLAAGKPKVADQTAFNYLINTKYYSDVLHTDLEFFFAVHLHVVNAGLVKFDLNNVSKYSIVHQYDRIPNFKK